MNQKPPLGAKALNIVLMQCYEAAARGEPETKVLDSINKFDGNVGAGLVDWLSDVADGFDDEFVIQLLGELHNVDPWHRDQDLPQTPEEEQALEAAKEFAAGVAYVSVALLSLFHELRP